MRFSLLRLFAWSVALIAESPPVSLIADKLVYKVESSTTRRHFTFMANDAFMKGIPRWKSTFSVGRPRIPAFSNCTR